MEALLIICRFCGIVPPSKNSKWKLAHHYYYSAFLATVLLVFSFYSIYFGIKEQGTGLSKTSLFVDLLTSIFLTMQGAAILIAYLIFPRKMRRFLDDLNARNEEKPHWHYYYYFELVVAHMALISKTSWQMMMWVPIVRLKLHQYYIFRRFHEYFALITTLLIVHINRKLKRKFSTLNDALDHSKSFSSRIRHLQGSYRKTAEMIDRFSQIFGYQIMFIMGNTVTTILDSFQIILLFSQSDKEQANLVIIASAINAIIVMVIRRFSNQQKNVGVVIFQVETVAIVISCDKTAEEASGVIGICERLQEQLPTRSKEREEIFRLLLVIETGKVRFSAAEYLRIDRSAIFSMLYVATTYLIIIIQFKQQYAQKWF